MLEITLTSTWFSVAGVVSGITFTVSVPTYCSHGGHTVVLNGSITHALRLIVMLLYLLLTTFDRL